VSGQIAFFYNSDFLSQVAKEEGRPQTGEKSVTKGVLMAFPTACSTVPLRGEGDLSIPRKALI
jgi:hypothetical protein